MVLSITKLIRKFLLSAFPILLSFENNTGSNGKKLIIWKQAGKSKICSNKLYSKSKIKNALRELAFNLINFEDARILIDSKKIKIIQQLRQNVATLKPDKGNGVVLLDNQDYVNSLEQLFKDKTKFKILEKDPTTTRMTTLQNCETHVTGKKLN